LLLVGSRVTIPGMRTFVSHGDGSFRREDFASIGTKVIFESGVLVFHPETISIGENVYVGHRAMLKGHPAGRMSIGENTWIGQNVFLHSAGGIRIGRNVGIGPNVTMLTSYHKDVGRGTAILDSPLDFKEIVVEDGVDIGVGAILLPGVTVGRGTQIGAGAVVTKDVPAYTVAAGNPARILRSR
jgi:acetyltransferase-like isoleucine patch superfamily enzyme